MNVSVNVPEDLYHRAAEIAAEENMSVDELFASAFEERLLELERWKEKPLTAAMRNSCVSYVLSKVPAVDSPEYDRL